MNRPRMPRSRPARKPPSPGLRKLLLAPLRGLAALMRFRNPRPTIRPKNPRPSPRAVLLPAGGHKRSLQEWKDLRKSTAAEVKAHLAEEQPVLAIKKLTRALLEDPQHPPYHELLKKAVEQRRARRLRAGRKDPWAELPRDLRQEALQLEAFTAYVDELEQLFDKAGIPPLAAPPPPGSRQARGVNGADAKTDVVATDKGSGGKGKSSAEAKGRGKARGKVKSAVQTS